MKNFKINHKNYYLLSLIVLLLALSLFYAITNFSKAFVFPLLLTPVAVSFYRLKKSYLQADKKILEYNNGFLDFKIKIDSIRSIEVKKNFLGFITRSMLVNYRKYDEIRVNPKDKQAFIDYLLKINPKIRIERL